MRISALAAVSVVLLGCGGSAYAGRDEIIYTQFDITQYAVQTGQKLVATEPNGDPNYSGAISSATKECGAPPAKFTVSKASVDVLTAGTHFSDVFTTRPVMFLSDGTTSIDVTVDDGAPISAFTGTFTVNGADLATIKSALQSGSYQYGYRAGTTKKSSDSFLFSLVPLFTLHMDCK